jgi:spermidine synthase
MTSFFILALVFTAGVAALSWEAVWQIQACLSIGVSALGTAVVLASTMGGMAIGSLWMARRLARRPTTRALRVYGGLELVIGVAGALLRAPGFAALERFDGAHYSSNPALMPVFHLVGIAVLLSPQTIAMGATIPVFGCIARQHRLSLSTMYATNTAGAALGVFVATFVLLPYLGVELSGIAIACLNVTVALSAQLLEARATTVGSSFVEPPAGNDRADRPSRVALFISFWTGVVSFGLEVAWFRSLRSVFWSTTQSFGVLLISVLVPLAFGARLARFTERRRLPLGAVLVASAASAFVSTPVIERADQLIGFVRVDFWQMVGTWTLAALLALGPTMALIGLCLPRLLDEAEGPRAWGLLYAANTLGCILGSICGAWLLLPRLGFARTVWLFATSLLGLGIVLSARRARWVSLAIGGAALFAAVAFESGLGRTRVSTLLRTAMHVVAFREGPDSTYAVVERDDGARLLMIDGYVATGELVTARYMRWMGHLPMILHPAPRSALVICFGTGQTANAVRLENPAHLEIVELSESVLRLAHHFSANQGVLDDPRVHATVMDGRAFLRRTSASYDVVTLEPMPPTFAGVNALYSREFYRLVEARLSSDGVVAQWLPLHMLSMHDAKAIAATFRETFPDSLLWYDAVGSTGILVGRKSGPHTLPFGRSWPGLEREAAGRDLPPGEVPAWVALNPATLETYSRGAEIITDDNQLLAYGPKRNRAQVSPHEVLRDNVRLIMEASGTDP